MMTWIDRRKNCSCGGRKEHSKFHFYLSFAVDLPMYSSNCWWQLQFDFLLSYEAFLILNAIVLQFLFGLRLHFMLTAFFSIAQGNTMKLLWTYNDKDPVYGHLKWHGTFSGVRSIHMLTPLWKKPSASHNANNRDTRQWDVTVKNVSCLFSPSSLAMLKMWSGQ